MVSPEGASKYTLFITIFLPINNNLHIFLVGLYTTAIGTIWPILHFKLLVSHYCYRFTD